MTLSSLLAHNAAYRACNNSLSSIARTLNLCPCLASTAILLRSAGVLNLGVGTSYYMHGKLLPHNSEEHTLCDGLKLWYAPPDGPGGFLNQLANLRNFGSFMPPASSDCLP